MPYSVAEGSIFDVADPFEGCYRDSPFSRDMCCGPKKLGYDGYHCKKACGAFKFYALQNDGFCSCDDRFSHPPIGLHRKDEPDMCNGNNFMGRGGEYTNAIYKIEGRPLRACCTYVQSLFHPLLLCVSK